MSYDLELLELQKLLPIVGYYLSFLVITISTGIYIVDKLNHIFAP